MFHKESRAYTLQMFKFRVCQQKALWLVSAVKIALRGGEEEIPQAALVQATLFHWSKLVVLDSQHQN